MNEFSARGQGASRKSGKKIVPSDAPTAPRLFGRRNQEVSGGILPSGAVRGLKGFAQGHGKK